MLPALAKVGSSVLSALTAVQIAIRIAVWVARHGQQPLQESPATADNAQRVQPRRPRAPPSSCGSAPECRTPARPLLCGARPLSTRLAAHAPPPKASSRRAAPHRQEMPWHRTTPPHRRPAAPGRRQGPVGRCPAAQRGPHAARGAARGLPRPSPRQPTAQKGASQPRRAAGQSALGQEGGHAAPIRPAREVPTDPLRLPDPTLARRGRPGAAPRP